MLCCYNYPSCVYKTMWMTLCFLIRLLASVQRADDVKRAKLDLESNTTVSSMASVVFSFLGCPIWLSGVQQPHRRKLVKNIGGSLPSFSHCLPRPSPSSFTCS